MNISDAGKNFDVDLINDDLFDTNECMMSNNTSNEPNREYTQSNINTSVLDNAIHKLNKNLCKLNNDMRNIKEDIYNLNKLNLCRHNIVYDTTSGNNPDRCKNNINKQNKNSVKLKLDKNNRNLECCEYNKSTFNKCIKEPYILLNNSRNNDIFDKSMEDDNVDETQIIVDVGEDTHNVDIDEDTLDISTDEDPVMSL